MVRIIWIRSFWYHTPFKYIFFAPKWDYPTMKIGPVYIEIFLFISTYKEEKKMIQKQEMLITVFLFFVFSKRLSWSRNLFFVFKNKKRSGTRSPYHICSIICEGRFYYAISYQLSKFNCLIVFASWDNG